MITATVRVAELTTKEETMAELSRQLRIAADILDSGEFHGGILRDKEGSFIGSLGIEEA